MTDRRLVGNVGKYYCFQAFNSVYFFAPVIVLFWQSHGLNMTQIMLLQSIFAMGMVLFEIPTGVMADILGKKISLILGTFIFSLGSFWYGISDNYWQFIIGELGCAIGMAFVSGADQAFIHQTLKNIGREKEFDQVEGRVRGFNKVLQIVGNIAGGLLATVSLSLTFVATGLSSLIASLIGLSFQNTSLELPRAEKTNYRQVVTQSWQLISRNRELWWLTFFFAIFNSLVFAANWFVQPFLQSLQIPVGFFGLIFAGFSLFSGFVSLFTSQLVIFFKKNIFRLLGWGAVGILLIISYWPSRLAIILFAGLDLMLVINQILVAEKTLTLVPTNRSATILSFQSLLRRLIYAMILPILGWTTDQFGLATAVKMNAGLLTISLVGLAKFSNYQKNSLVNVRIN